MEVSTNVAPATGEQTITSDVPAPDRISARDAGQLLAQMRWKRENPTPVPESPPAEARAPVEEHPVEAEQAEAVPPEAETSGEVETEAAPEPEADLPPIEPPRSWSSEHKDRFASLPRDTQEYIAQREQDRERELRRGQNEHAEKLKGLTAKEQQAEQARQQYEQALPALLESLQSSQQGEFADIKTMADVENLARNDWPRYALWDAQQKKIAAVHQEMQAAQERQTKERTTQWNTFAAREDQAFLEAVPEMKDTKKAEALKSGAMAVLEDIGFTPDDLQKLWSGQTSVSLRDHRIQRLIVNAVRLKEAQKVAAKPASKPLPPVQRPGTAGTRVDAQTLEIQRLQKAFADKPTARNAADLRLAQRRAAQSR